MQLSPRANPDAHPGDSPAGFRIAWLVTMFGSQLATAAVIAAAWGWVRPPAGGVAVWVWAVVLGTLVLASAVVAVAARRTLRQARPGIVMAVVAAGAANAVVFAAVRGALLLARP